MKKKSIIITNLKLFFETHYLVIYKIIYVYYYFYLNKSYNWLKKICD